MKIWCIPTSTSIPDPTIPLLPPRTDRDVFFRSPPPPPRLSRQEKLDRGVIVLKPKKVRVKKPESAIKRKVEIAPVKRARRVRYADQEKYWITPEQIPDLPAKEDKKEKEVKADKVEQEDIFCDICCFQDRCTHEEVWRQRAEDLKSDPIRPPSRGTEVVHSRQQSNTSGTSSSLTLGSSLTSRSSHNYQSYGHDDPSDDLSYSQQDLSYPQQDLSYGQPDLKHGQHNLNYSQNDPGYSSSSGCGSSECRSPSPQTTDSSTLLTHSSTLLTRPPHRRTRTRLKKTNSSTLTFSVGGLIQRKPNLTHDLMVLHGGRLVSSDLRTSSFDNIIQHPGKSRLRDRRNRGRGKHRQKGCLPSGYPTNQMSSYSLCNQSSRLRR